MTLEGHVNHDFQRREVERMVRHVRGVNDVINDVTVTAPETPDRVAKQIEEAFKRAAEVTHAVSKWRYPITLPGYTGMHLG